MILLRTPSTTFPLVLMSTGAVLRLIEYIETYAR